MSVFAVYGAGGHARVVADAILAAGGHVVAFVDDAPARVGASVLGIAVRGNDWLFSDPAAAALAVALGVGDNFARRRIAELCLARGRLLPPVVHPAATVASSATLGTATFCAARAVVNASAAVGAGVIVNTGAIIEHDVRVGDFAHVSPGACLAGGSALGALSHLGAGAVVLDDIFVGSGCIVGAAAMVNRHLPDDVVAYGVPARIRRAITAPKEST